MCVHLPLFNFFTTFVYSIDLASMMLGSSWCKNSILQQQKTWKKKWKIPSRIHSMIVRPSVHCEMYFKAVVADAAPIGESLLRSGWKCGSHTYNLYINRIQCTASEAAKKGRKFYFYFITLLMPFLLMA